MLYYRGYNSLMAIHETPLYNLEISQILSHFQATTEGLSSSEVNRRLKQYGPNELSEKKTPLWKRLVEPFANYFVAVIIVAAVLSLVEHKWFEAIIMSGIIVINAFIYYFQQFSVSRALKDLRDKDALTVMTVRGGQDVELASSQLVPGDIVHVVEGMKVPADGRLVEAAHVQADESMLTGESLPVHKQAEAVAGKRAVYDQNNMLFKGTFVHSGSGLLLITSTGDHTQLGAINRLTAEADETKTPIAKKIDQLTTKLLLAIGITSVVVFALAIIRGIALDEALRFTLSLVVSAVPEGLPVAMTLVLLFNARRMARQKALVKNIAVMETLGAITVIATDKTGTITQNKLAVAQSYTIHSSVADFHWVIHASLNGEDGYYEDPLDNILHQSIEHSRAPAGWKKVKDFPFNQELRLSASVWSKNGRYHLFAKGAPEQILAHCQVGRDGREILSQLRDFTGKGYRTIGFARRPLDSVPEKLTTKQLAHLQFAGLIGLSDQLRPKVSQAIREAKAAGIKVIMLTGDHLETAAHIAGEVGISSSDQEVADSKVLGSKSLSKIREALAHTTVFGRVLPEHKFALLKALQGKEITAMTGDGVNDIPALVEADAGLAMGSGTDAAKDASDIVLLNSNFHTIVGAIRSGRTVLANIRKMIVYLLGTNGGEVLTMLAALVLNIPLPLTAVMILWVNLVTDGVSVIPLGLSPSEEHHMHQPPNKPQAPLLNKVLLTRAILLAVVMATVTLSIFKLYLPLGQAYAQTAAFLSLIVIQWANAFNMNLEHKSWLANLRRPNIILVLAIGGSVLLNIAIFMTPLKQVFGLVSLQTNHALVSIVLPIVIALVACDAHKLVSHLATRRASSN